ncbi:hypothetical protein DSM112329_01550 [Paraconexibacter sp. AEG42_29]|uniref:PE-PGRS family protein n=1 Tax=Paraconexibacter sp. AEG42_29 TaxID=2997339 RepID=A0AAU7ASX5_9ACTN
MSLFAFVQMEFPWEIGPPDGRYVLRGHAGQPSHVLVVTTLGAVERRRLLSKRSPKPKAAGAEPGPEPVTTTRVTLVQAEALADEAAGQAWMKTANLSAEVDDAIDVLNGVLHAHRTSAMDPFTRDVTRRQALVVRSGVGEGEAVAHGRWATAVEIPSPAKPASERRTAALRPQERLAAILSGRDVALASEELVLRARADIDAGRTREASLQVRVALEAAIAELEPWADGADLARRIEELRELRAPVAAAANSALQGGLDDETAERVEHAIKRVEAALRVRTNAGLA